MFNQCLFCADILAGIGSDRERPAEGRVAFDPGRARVWTLCSRCHGWNLWPIEDRLEALEALERVAFDRARLLFQTEHIALLQAGDLELVRVGRAERREEAWWRYGRRLRERRDRYANPLSRVGAVAYLAVSNLGHGLGLERITGDFRTSPDRYADVLRWRRFGRTAWKGRAPCPRCCSVLIRLFFFKADALLLLPSDGNDPTIAMPCSRCDPWTVEKVHRFDTRTGQHVLRRVLAYQNIKGATERDLSRAVREIDEAGSTGAFLSRLAEEPTPLHDLPRSRRLALEISVNESAERRQLAREAATVEAGWRRAEELAAIIDEEL